ncbi:WLM domain-domain-containing protein [Coniella lustricola]|uniref:WLM domain-domain-containing protein n=1 Tax=Coniella lustricola TaxID=2025994 RepID=A0A2T3AD59_9PEZI|nr:WLM domain-domain-containing protein [Coniella lustricola]
MPLGIQRLNARKSQPNERIVFIKPLKGSHEAVAQDFLERIAAQCLPIMKEHHLSLTTLEEYEPNREFVGRNFNNGEIVQLVLRSRSSSSDNPRWLPFHYVQMVMMHELAHCVQMNHSRAFWAVRNLYADQMRTLWGRGYLGEGIWGRGAKLASGEFERSVMAPGEDLPEHLCGGTFRSRRRGRKRGRKGAAGSEQLGELSYQEKKQRRIEKKFGKNGVALGADEGVKVKLEKGKRVQAAPRVAGSNRGRELRAAAALARFEQQKEDEPEMKVVKNGDGGEDSENESDYEDGDTFDGDLGADDAVDLDGQKLVDSKGNHMVKVCEDENPGDEEVANEMKELQASITTHFGPAKISKQIKSQGQEASLDLELPSSDIPLVKPTATSKAVRDSPCQEQEARQHKPAPTSTTSTSMSVPAHRQQAITCKICSYENEVYTVTCQMCSNVLSPASVPSAWRCQSASCEGSAYLNAGDCGICGVCGQRKTGVA